MYPVCVVPNKPVNEFGIEHLGRKEFLGVIVHKSLLNCSVESFHVRVHLGSLGIRMIVGKVQAFQLLGKVFHKFRAIVREYEYDRKRKYRETQGEKFFGSEGCVTFRSPGKGVSRVYIFKGNDVAS